MEQEIKAVLNYIKWCIYIEMCIKIQFKQSFTLLNKSEHKTNGT